MMPDELEIWVPLQQQREVIACLGQRVGITRIRAECFVRLWVYLLVKYYQEQKPLLKPPLGKLELPPDAVVCTHREAANLFYGDKEQGSDRAAGMMLDKLVALGLIKTYFDGNCTCITINPIPEVLELAPTHLPAQLQPDAFNARCDAIPIANLLASNYNWMNRNTNATPQRIARLLRQWANQYATGMRVLRRLDNQHPVGFYLLYPVAPESEANFFTAPRKSLHLSTLTDVDPFTLANLDDPECMAVFIRSWMIDTAYSATYRVDFLQDMQQTLKQMQQDFPNLCDLYTLLIHPSYEELAQKLGFQFTVKDTKLSVYWAYLALDRFLALEMQTVLAN